MSRFLIALVAGAILAAGCDRDHSVPEPIVLRVSASHGLPSSHNGSMAYAHDLTYLLPYEYKLQRRGERSVALRPLQPPEEIAQYCQKLCIERSTRIVREGATCIIEFETTRSRDEFADSEFLPVGPFRLHRPLSSDAETATQTIELIDECDRTAIDVIRIQATTTAAEWKELYAGEVDVVPMTSIAHLQRFERMGTIKTKILPASNAISLFFNTERAPWSSPSVRRRIAAAIDTWAVADVVCRGYRSCSIEPRPIIIGNEALATAGPPLELPQELSVLVPSSDLEAIEAAKTTVFHLRTKLQVEIEVESLPLEKLLARLSSGDFDLVVVPLPKPQTPDRAERTVERLGKVARYHNPALRRAADAGDLDEFRDILADEMPIVQLFDYVQFAAIDQRFCYDRVPDSQRSWYWLSYLRPCDRER